MVEEITPSSLSDKLPESFLVWFARFLLKFMINAEQFMRDMLFGKRKFLDKFFLNGFRPGEMTFISDLQQNHFPWFFQTSVGMFEENWVIFVEMEAEFEKNEVEAVALAFFYELIAGYFEDIGSGYVGVDVYKLSFFFLDSALCDNEVSVFAVTRSEVDGFVVLGEEVGKIEGELMDNSKIHQ